MTPDKIEGWRTTLIGSYRRAFAIAPSVQQDCIEQLNAIFDLAVKGASAPPDRNDVLEEDDIVDVDIQGLLANVIDHWERVPNDIRSDPGMDKLNNAIRNASVLIGEPTK